MKTASMHITIFTVALLCGTTGLAEDKKQADGQKKAELGAQSVRQDGAFPITVKKPVGAAKAKDVSSSNPSFTVFEAWSSFTVSAGGVFNLTSTGDYTGADHISIAIECPNGTNLAASGITVWWGISLANRLTLTDVVNGADFLLKNMGGANVPVYGSQLMLQVVNSGSTAISCDQVTTYAVVH